MVRVGGDAFGDDGDGDKEDKKERPTTPAPISEVGDNNESSEEFTPVLISSFLVSRFQQEVGDTPSELVLTPAAVAYAPSASDNVDAVTVAAEDDVSLGAAAPPPPQSRRRQPTPEEAERYAEVARQLNEVARQIETEYSNDLDELVDSLNLVSDVAYDAFAAVAKSIFSNGITWSRVLVLILFGWRVIKKVYLTWTSTSGYVQRILDYILKFITDNVLAWVTDHGGWVNLLRNPPTSPTDGRQRPFLPDALAPVTVERAIFVAAVGACAVLAYLFWTKRN